MAARHSLLRHFARRSIPKEWRQSLGCSGCDKAVHIRTGGLVAGSYPALYLSGFNPVTVLKGKLNSSIGEVWVRKGLVGFQFTLSIVLIVSVLVVYKQIEFVQRQNLGYNKDNVIYFDVEGRVKESPETFLSEIKKIPGIKNAASSTHDMVGHGWSTGLNWEGKETDDYIPVQIMVPLSS